MYDELVKSVTAIQTTDTSNLVKKADKYVTTQEFNRLTSENLSERLGQADLVSKNDFDEKRRQISRIYFQ